MNTATLESTTSTTGIIQHVIPLSTAKSIASLVVFTSKDKITPALTVVKVVFGEKITATATDRYAVGKGTYDGVGTEGTIYLDAAACKFIASYKVARFQDPMIAFDVLDNILKIKTSDTSTSGLMYEGNYPAVETLFEAHKPAEAAEVHRFNIDLLAKLGKVVGTDGSKVENWQFEFGTRTQPNRPAPVVATASNFTALIQPTLLAR
jgi:DNA polymerase III sliding clamp (beta) subunit (PCNA family)